MDKEINYNAYNPEIVDSLMQVDDAIGKAEHELKALRKETEVLKDPDRLELIKSIISDKEDDLKRFRQEREDVLNSV